MKRQAKSLSEMKTKCGEVSEVLKALAHPQRLMMLCHLSTGEKTVTELEELCGTSQSAMSQFLNRMKREGFINSEKRGQFVFYRITDPKVSQLISNLYEIFCK